MKKSFFFGLVLCLQSFTQIDASSRIILNTDFNFSGKKRGNSLDDKWCKRFRAKGTDPSSERHDCICEAPQNSQPCGFVVETFLECLEGPFPSCLAGHSYIKNKSSYIYMMRSALSSKVPIENFGQKISPDFFIDFKKLFDSYEEEKIDYIINLQIPFNIEGFNLRDRFIYFAAGTASLETFLKLYDKRFGPIREDAYINLYELMYSSLVCENFEVSKFLSELSSFDINHKVDNKTLLAAIIEKSDVGNFDGQTADRLSFERSIRWLIQKGIDVSDGYCLHLAITYDNLAAVKLLLSTGIRLELWEAHSGTPLELSVEIRRFSIFETIAAYQIANEIELENISRLFYNLLLNGTDFSSKFINILIRLKFEPKIYEEGAPCYLLHFCAHSHLNSLLELFLNNGADPFESFPSNKVDLLKDAELAVVAEEMLNIGLNYEDPAIAVAIAKNNVEAVIMFLESGVGPEIKLESGATLIEFSKDLGLLSITKLLEFYSGQSNSKEKEKEMETKNITLQCGHMENATKIHNLFRRSRNSFDAICSHCHQPINYDHYFESLLGLDVLPAGIFYYRHRSNIVALTESLWPKLTNPAVDVKILRNAVSLRTPFALMESIKKERILRVASQSFDSQKFEILYNEIIKPNPNKKDEKFILMKTSLMSENFSVADFLVKKCAFNINYSKSIQDELLLDSIVIAGADDVSKDYSKIVQWFVERGADLNIKCLNENRTSIYSAISNNNLGMLKALLDAKVNLSVTDSLNFTPLTFAVATGKLEAVKIFVDRGIDVRFEYSGNGYNMLQVSIITGQIEVMNYLSSMGFEPILKTGEKSHVFHRAVLRNRYNAIEHCLERGADAAENCDSISFDKYIPYELGLKERLKQDDPAIVIAIFMNRKRFVELFLDHGIDPNMKILTSRSLLNLAYELNRIEIAQMLISRGADLGSVDEKLLCMSPHFKACGRPNCLEHNSSLLKLACNHYEHASCLQRCFEKRGFVVDDGSNPEHCKECHAPITFLNFFNAIFAAKYVPKGVDFSNLKMDFSFIANAFIVLSGPKVSTQLVQSLFNSGFPVDYLDNGKLTSFLRISAAISTAEKFKYFFEHRMASFNPLNNDEIFEILFTALIDGNFPVAEYILSTGFDINCRSRNMTILVLILTSINKKMFLKRQVAVHHEAVLKWLIANGADINATEGSRNSSPLYVSVITGRQEDMKLLLDAGADHTIYAVSKHSAVSLAASLGDINALELFSDYKIDLKEQFTNTGISLLQVAIVSEQIDTCKYLIAQGVPPISKNRELSYLLHRLVAFNLLKALEFVLKIGADPMEKCNRQSFEKLTSTNDDLKNYLSNDDPAIVIAIVRSNFRAVELFLNAGISPNLRIFKCSSTILHLACQMKSQKIAHLLISRGADTASIDSFGKTAFEYFSDGLDQWLLNPISQNYYDNLDI